MSFARDYVLSKFFGNGSSGSGDLKALVERTITEIEDDTIEKVGDHAFRGCATLTEVNFPNCKEIGINAFYECRALCNFNFDSVQSIGANAFSMTFTDAELYIPGNPTLEHNAFQWLGALKVYAPKLTTVPLQCFHGSGSLKRLELPSCTNLGNNCIGNCTALEYLDIYGGIIHGNFFANMTKFKTFIIRQTDKPAALWGNTLSTNTPFATGEGRFYVPRALIAGYEAETNFSVFPGQFLALEDYTVDGTTTGKFDESKI